MYLRPVHTDLHFPTLHQFIRQYPLGLLTTAIPSPNFPLLQTSHIPWVLDLKDEDSLEECGVLRGHAARQNPQVKAMIEAARANGGGGASYEFKDEVMVLFNSPNHSYVTPKFYIETKPSTGKVVPTWNYAAVQAYGKLRLFFENDETTNDFLMKQVDDLTVQQEEKTKPWKVSDAPEKYVTLLSKGIVGFEITLERLGGKFKMSQESTVGDREGVIKGFEAKGTAEGKAIASMVAERGAK